MLVSSSKHNFFNEEETIVRNALMLISQEGGEYDVSDERTLLNETRRILNMYPAVQKSSLHYQNQPVEIPIFGDLNLRLNSNFPYRREPISISTDLDHFIENFQSFSHFKKVLLRNVELELLPETFAYHPLCTICRKFLYKEADFNDHHHHANSSCIRPSFKINCKLKSNECELECPISESTLLLANIFLQLPHIWLAIYDTIMNNTNLNLEMKRRVFLHCFQNLFKCFIEIQFVDLAVTINDGKVEICNVFHNYYTQ